MKFKTTLSKVAVQNGSSNKEGGKALVKGLKLVSGAAVDHLKGTLGSFRPIVMLQRLDMVARLFEILCMLFGGSKGHLAFSLST